MTKRRKTQDEQAARPQHYQQDDEYTPLPIQTFLWRQTSPFVRPFLGKARDLAQIEQRDACKLFERIIITNNIFGQSPSLTDAIASIDRWRLIKVSFPFVLQCTASLLNNKLIKDHTFNRLGSNEAKMMYTLQWILMNASEECADSELEAKTNATSVAMAAATAAASLLRPSDALGPRHAPGARSQGSMGSVSGATGEQQQVTPTSGIQHSEHSKQDAGSVVIPAATSAAMGTVAAVAAPSGLISNLRMQAAAASASAAASKLPSSSSVSPIGSSTPTKQPATPTSPETAEPGAVTSNYLLPISSIQMFVYYFAPIMDGLKHSDFLTSNQRLEIGAALWEPLFNHQLPQIQCLIAQVRPRRGHREFESAAFFAPATSIITSAVGNVLEDQKTGASLVAAISEANRRRSSALIQDQSQFGDVFLGGPTLCVANAAGGSQVDKTTGARSSITGATIAHPVAKCPYATYLDVAVLRCLYISDWQESGVSWALTYLANRLADMQYVDESVTHFHLRPRSRSLDGFDRAAKKPAVSCAGRRLKYKKSKQQAKNSRGGAAGSHNQSSSRFLRVEDAEQSDSGENKGSSPIRRLSFSSGVQTLANQIRKTSRRVKKSTDSHESGSQLSINQIEAGRPRIRRSSSADDLTSSQVSALSMLHRDGHLNQSEQMVAAFADPNPVITVTSNAYSPLQMKHVRDPQSASADRGRVKSSSHKLDPPETEKQQFLVSQLFSRSLKHLDRLTRSQTIPANMHFLPFETSKDQADSSAHHGAALYVDDFGRIDPIVVLKVIHSVSRRESACSLRVCDRVLSLVSKLISAGILKRTFNLPRRQSQSRDLTNLLVTNQHKHEFRLISGGLPQILKSIDSDQNSTAQQRFDEAVARATLIHKILVDIVFRVYNHLGCPNHCGAESTVDHHQQTQQGKLSCSGKTSAQSSEYQASLRSFRSKLRDTLDFLCNYNRENFIKYAQDVFNNRPLQQVVDILHSLLGFCRPNSANQSQPSATSSCPQTTVQFVQSPGSSSANPNEGQSRCEGSVSSMQSDASTVDQASVSKQPTMVAGQSQPMGVSPRQAARPKRAESVESIIVSNSFKQLITRMAKINKELKLQENAYLYCNIRRLIVFTRENYNSVFRSIVLSALIDSTKLLNQQQKQLESENKSRSGAEFTRMPSEEDSTNGEISAKTHQTTNAEPLDSVASDPGDSGGKRDEFASPIGMHQSPSSMHAAAGAQESMHQHQFRAHGQASRGVARDMSPIFKQRQLQQVQLVQTNSDQQPGGLLSLSKAKKKLEQVFGGKTGAHKGAKYNSQQQSPHFGDNLAHSGTIGSQADGADHNSMVGAGDEVSRKASIGHQSFGSIQDNQQHSMSSTRNVSALGNSEEPGGGLTQQQIPNLNATFQLIKHNAQIYEAIQTGMSNFAFLMESCAPGDFLDPAMLAALLDLKSPVVVRAAIFLECANFVHKCNRGQWPPWMRMSMSTRRTSNLAPGAVVGSASLGGGKLRKSSSIQRTTRNNTLMYRSAGRAFYLWAEAVGARLEELLSQTSDSTSAGDADSTRDPEEGAGSQPTSEQVASSLDVDFLQPAIGGDTSPFALKMAACHLLFEVTTFLRETYRYLPPTIVQHQITGAKLGEKLSIYDVSRAVTANRRWSMALSSLGFGQLPATLSAISAGAAAVANQPTGSHLRNPASSISEHPERRISFILHETNDEDEAAKHERESEKPSGEQQEPSQQVVASPLAPSVNTDEQQQDAMRKMTSGRHISQAGASSAVVVAAATCLLRSSGVIDSQSHRRKSIKLKKSTQDKEQKQEAKKVAKFAQDLDEDPENSSISDVGLRRTDSVRSRRRVSGISEKSDASDRPSGQHVHESGQAHGSESGAQTGAGEGSGDDSAGNASCEENYAAGGGENTDRYEDESRIMSNMPWFKAIAMINSSIDCSCSHFPNCKARCYKIHQDMCRRLVPHVQSIYEDPFSQGSFGARVFESRLEKLLSLSRSRHHRRFPSQDSKSKLIFGSAARTGSDCSASILDNGDQMPPAKARRDKKSKKHQLTDSPRDERPLGKVKGKFASSSLTSSTGLTAMINETMRALVLARAKEQSAKKSQDEPQIVKYIKSSVKSLLHCPMSSFLKGAVILPRENFTEMVGFSWNLLLEDDQQISRTAAVSFIIASIKCPGDASKLLMDELASADASRKIAAINKFYVIWDARYQCWPRLEDGAFVHFKMAPPSIEFTLPSPKIAQESRPVVDPPWMPRKTSNVEEVTIGQDQSVQKSFVTATKTRRKQQIEIVTKALREKHDKLREDRENYLITSVPITLYAAFEPTLGAQAGGGSGGTDELDGMGGGGTGGGAGTSTQDEDAQENRALLQMKTVQALFPSCLCQAAIVMINLLDDSRVTYEGSAVYEVASKAIWSCLVDDPALFLRYFFERLTRQNQSTTFQVLRRLIRFMPRLPSQAAYTLYNYLIGFIIYCIRSSAESHQKLIADTLSVLCLVVPSVYGLFLKDLKQILRKEQCDHNLLITANIPGTKKIVVECESDSSGIPNQFDVGETTQFYHILVESLGFWKIERPRWNEHFLMDIRTNYLYNLHSYVRDYYSYKTPYNQTQLQVIKLDPSKAFDTLQSQELINQFMEFGKVSMALAIVKSSHMAVQRVLFLHEELMKLPTFPRKALETNFGLFRGPLGHQVFSLDRIHKICWVRTIARMFELTSGFFLQLGDIQLFLNAICGIFVLHCEEAAVLRLCLATFINATHQFKNIFATEGFMSIMGTIVQVYSNHQNNQLLCSSIEFVCKQFYIVHRKPFLLQLFGSVAARLNTAEILQQTQANSPLAMNQSAAFSTNTNLNLTDPSRISPAAFFRLLQSLEGSFKDPIDILELVDAEKPLRAIDFCYQQDKESIGMLDIISLCVTVTAYASDSPRSTQMLIILETVVPLYMKHLQAGTSRKAGQSMGKEAHKIELQKIQSISICIRTLIVNCEGLTRNFNGPLPSFDFRSSSIRRTGSRDAKRLGGQRANQSASAGSPMDLYQDEPSISGPEKSKKDRHESNRQANMAGGLHRGGAGTKGPSSEENEITRGEFLVPRDTLLNLVAEFLSLSTGRLVESAKKYVDLHQKHSSYELLDVKSHLRLAEVANSLLKFASTDPSVMASRGLVRYMNEILPNTEWRQEAIRPALILILKRLDKTFNRIAKKTWIKRSTDWEGAKQLLKGAYLTFIKHPYIVHLPHLKSLISCCQNIILSDGLQSAQTSSNIFHSLTASSQPTTGTTATQQQVSASTSTGATAGLLMGGLPLDRRPTSVTPNLLSVSPSAGQSPAMAAGGVLPTTATGSSAPSTSYLSHQAPSLAALTAAAQLAERLAANAAAGCGNSITSQGFNSVTIRLIAMQLLQTGENQTLESLVGSSTNTPEKLEAIMLNLIYPMCIRVCSGAREAPKLRVCDIMFILNIVLNMLAPNSASSKGYASASTSPKATTDTSQFILSKITTTIGSTQTGASALGIVGGSSAHSAASIHQLAQHQEALKIGFLGLKILCVCFESQLAGDWIRITRVIRDLALQAGQPCGPLWDFLDFVATYKFPMFVLLLPMIKCQLAEKVREDQSSEHMAHYQQCQRMIDAKIHGLAPTVCRSKSFLFVSLTAELRMLKEQLVVKRRQLLEGERRSSSHGAGQAGAGGSQGGGASNTLASNTSNDGSSQPTGDHFNAYYRLSAAIASFANQSGAKQSAAADSAANPPQQLGTALKGACFAAQLATSTPLSDLTAGSGSPQEPESPRAQQSQSSIRLGTARNREEARKVMNTILRRTSYPHNAQGLAPPDKAAGGSGERKNSQPPPSLASEGAGQVHAGAASDVESGRQQLIMDPAMLMAAFPTPRKSTAEGSGILKQLIQTIDTQNNLKQKQRELSQRRAEPPTSSSASQLSTPAEQVGVTGSRSQGFQGHRHQEQQEPR